MEDVCRHETFNKPKTPLLPSEKPVLYDSADTSGRNETRSWYALKVFHNRMHTVAEELKPVGIDSYIPMQTVVAERGGVKRKLQKPAIASLMFFRSTPSQAIAIGRSLTDRAILYTRQNDNGQRIPAAIPEREMDIFRLVVSSGADGLEYLPDDPERFRKGDRVRVTAGPLAGAEGHIARIRGDRRLVVSVRGICAVATAYIPQCFLEPI